MSYKGLATLLFRCSGLISALVGLFQTAVYAPMTWDASGVLGGEGLVWSVMMPSLATVVGGLMVFLFSGVLGRLAARGLE